MVEEQSSQFTYNSYVHSHIPAHNPINTHVNTCDEHTHFYANTCVYSHLHTGAHICLPLDTHTSMHGHTLAHNLPQTPPRMTNFHMYQVCIHSYNLT